MKKMKIERVGREEVINEDVDGKGEGTIEEAGEGIVSCLGSDDFVKDLGDCIEMVEIGSID